MIKLILLKLSLLVSIAPLTQLSFAQSKVNEYVPCQEMPNIIQHYNADYRALSRFYSHSSVNALRLSGGMGV